MNRVLPTFDFGLHRTTGKGMHLSKKGINMEKRIPKRSPTGDFSKSLTDKDLILHMEKELFQILIENL